MKRCNINCNINCANYNSLKNYVTMLEEKIRELEIKNNELKKDKLTGVWNRHYLDEMLQEYKNKIDKGWHYNAYMVDINDLHKFNRKYGYLAGDEYIKEIVSNIRYEIESQKVSADIFRTGGDEFLIFTQPYDKLVLNIKNATISSSIFNGKFNELIHKLDDEIIKKKGNK